jgi:hypothetical protein
MKVLLGGQLDEAAPSGGAAAMSAGPPAPRPPPPKHLPTVWKPLTCQAGLLAAPAVCLVELSLLPF